jgi:hypothetical protein
VEQFVSEFRLGDVIDDHCIKCRRLTNHSIVSIVDGKVAKVRCRTCYNDHDYRFEQAPPSKKDLKKAELFKEVLATVNPATEAEAAEPEPPAVEAAAAPAGEPAPAGESAAATKKRGRVKRA